MTLIIGINDITCDECHTKIDLFEVRKIGLQNCVKFVHSKYSHVFGIKIIRNSSNFYEITPLFDIPDSIPTMTGYIQPCFEP